MKHWIFIAIQLVAFFGPALASVPAAERKTEPLQVKSDELITDSANRTATFTGKVTARQGDVTMYADKLVVTYAEKGKGVDKVEAFGNVRIAQGDRLAEAGHAFYENKAGKIILDKSPKVFQGDNVVTGKIITYFLDDRRSVVEGRVEAVIHPADKGKK